MKTALLLLGFIAVAASLAVQPQRDNAVICAICEELVEEAEKEGGNDIETYLNTKIEELCKKTSFLKEICEKTLKEAVSELVTWIKQKATPEKACQECDLC
ncbi:unnamed protein product, partial [Mesorhabditis spiculigera]